MEGAANSLSHKAAPPQAFVPGRSRRTEAGRDRDYGFDGDVAKQDSAASTLTIVKKE
jgi:hypothetical protein